MVKRYKKFFFDGRLTKAKRVFNTFRFYRNPRSVPKQHQAAGRSCKTVCVFLQYILFYRTSSLPDRAAVPVPSKV